MKHRLLGLLKRCATKKLLVPLLIVALLAPGT